MRVNGESVRMIGSARGAFASLLSTIFVSLPLSLKKI